MVLFKLMLSSKWLIMKKWRLFGVDLSPKGVMLCKMLHIGQFYIWKKNPNRSSQCQFSWHALLPILLQKNWQRLWQCTWREQRCENKDLWVWRHSRNSWWCWCVTIYGIKLLGWRQFICTKRHVNESLVFL